MFVSATCMICKGGSDLMRNKSCCGFNEGIFHELTLINKGHSSTLNMFSHKDVLAQKMTIISSWHFNHEKSCVAHYLYLLDHNEL